jgi:hypothetical protein
MEPNSSRETAHAVRVSFRLLARYFPFRPPPGKEGVTLAQLAPIYTRWELGSVLLLFVCAPFTIWAGKLLLARVFPPPPAPAGALYHAVGDPAFMILPGLFLGLVLAAAPVMAGMKLLLRGRFSEYLLYGNLKVGFDATKVWGVMAVIISAGALALAAAAGPVHFTVFPDHLELRDIGYSGPRKIPYTQVATVGSAPDGRVELTFVDGTHWSSADNWGLLILPTGIGPMVLQQARAAQH